MFAQGSGTTKQLARILEESASNSETPKENSRTGLNDSPVTSHRTVKSATRPSRLFRANSIFSGVGNPTAMDTDGPLDKFNTSKEFAQLMTLPIKCPDSLLLSSSLNKENDNVMTFRNTKHLLSDDEEFKECGDGFKRPIAPCTPIQRKRTKCIGHWKSSPCYSSNSPGMEVDDTTISGEDESQRVNSPRELEPMDIGNSARKLSRSLSESAVISAVEKGSRDPLLVGDFSRRFILPVVTYGKHSDLKEIDGSTLVDIMNGHYTSLIRSAKIIDCRYPYEYEGGHIKGAINLYTQRQIRETLMEKKTRKSDGSQEAERDIIIFHCEFSSQRAPELCRYLRAVDRTLNDFPWLHYPELYVLFGGYKNFFLEHWSHCEPQAYCTMWDTKFKEEYKKYKNMSKDEIEMSKPKSVKRFPRFSSDTVVKQPKF